MYNPYISPSNMENPTAPVSQPQKEPTNSQPTTAKNKKLSSLFSKGMWDSGDLLLVLILLFLALDGDDYEILITLGLLFLLGLTD